VKLVTRRYALRQAELDGAACPVPGECVEALRAKATVTVALGHRERGLTPTRQRFEAALREDDGWHVSGVDWPEDVRPGVLVTVTWRAAQDEVVVRTSALDEPMRIDGVVYFHEYDAEVVTRECAPGEANWAKVLHTVRRLGRVFDDGSAVFPEAQLAARSGLGKGTRGSFLLRNAVDQLIREGYVTRVEGSVDAAGHPSYPAVDGAEPAEMLLYAPLVEPAPHADDSAERREHWVNGFVRKLPPGAHASPKQVEAAGTALPPGYTFVKKHHRNG
jgi:hypothetical protein